MGRVTWFVISFTFLILVFPTIKLQAQFTPAPVEKSTQKILYQGKAYYVHTIKASQTLYSISRAYGVTQQDIAAANPTLALEVIQPGQVIKIPVLSTLDSISESYFGLSKDDFYYHTIQPKQTVLYLTRTYKVDKETIYKYNPETEGVLQVGQVVKIPKPHVLQNKPKQQYPDKSYSYTVKAGDTLYSLAKKYGVSVSDFINTNPDLRWGLKAGMTLQVPGSSIPHNLFEASPDDSFRPEFTRMKLLNRFQCDSIQRNNRTGAIKIVVMLPFYVDETIQLDSIKNDSIKRGHLYNRNKAIGRSFIEFYEGLVLSLDSIKSLGQNITLFTYDTKYDTTQVDKILKELEIIKPDFIIGPVKGENIQRASAFSDSNQIPLILPLTKASKGLTGTNPYVITLLPDFETELALASDFLSQYHDQNIVMVHNQDTSRMDNINFLRKTLFDHFSSKSSYQNALFKEIRINDTLKRNLAHAFREDLENIVIIASNNEAYVSNIIGLLTIQKRAYKIRVFGLPSWQKFKNLRVDQLHSLNTILYTPFFIDYTKPSTKRFVERCRKDLGYEPYRTDRNGNGFNFTYLGYETGLLFSKAFKNYGPNFINCLCTIKETMPQLEYEFKINKQGGIKIYSINFINFSKEFDLYRIPFVHSESNEIINSTNNTELHQEQPPH